ncbi:MAG: thiol-disulfide oxidoreductase DCC family protein [Pirellulales bacterium]
MTEKNVSKMGSGDYFEVFFDGGCPLCKREINMIRRKDNRHQLLLTDISSEGFSPPESLTSDQLMRSIHGRMPTGEYVVGVEVFRQIYQRLGFQRTVSLSQVPGIGFFLNAGYYAFAKLRYWHAMHRMKKRVTSIQ